jgi:hypothetical protein
VAWHGVVVTPASWTGIYLLGLVTMLRSLLFGDDQFVISGDLGGSQKSGGSVGQPHRPPAGRHQRASQSVQNGEEPPDPRYALELMIATIPEFDTRAGDEVGHRARDKDLTS